MQGSFERMGNCSNLCQEGHLKGSNSSKPYTKTSPASQTSLKAEELPLLCPCLAHSCIPVCAALPKQSFSLLCQSSELLPSLLWLSLVPRAACLQSIISSNACQGLGWGRIIPDGKLSTGFLGEEELSCL